ACAPLLGGGELVVVGRVEYAGGRVLAAEPLARGGVHHAVVERRRLGCEPADHADHLHAASPRACSAQRRIDSSERSTSASRVAQLDTLMRIAARSRQRVGPHQQTPSSCTSATVRAAPASSPNATTTWFSAP